MDDTFNKLSEIADNIKKFSITPGRPLYYFCYYEAAGGTPDFALNDSQKLILGFKDPRKTYFQESQNKALELMYNFLDKNFGEIKDYTIIPIPASNAKINQIRFGFFLNKLCDKLGVENGFNYVNPFQNRPAKHIGSKYINFSDYVSFDNTLKGKNIIIFDDVVTRGRNMKEMWDLLEAIGGKPFLALSLGRTMKYIPGMRKGCLIQTTTNPYIKKEEPKIEPVDFSNLKKIRDKDNDWESLYSYLEEKVSKYSQSWRDKYCDNYNLELLSKKKPITISEFEEIEEFQSPTLFKELNFIIKHIKEYYENKIKNMGNN